MVQMETRLLRSALLAGAIAAALALGACGGSDGGDDATGAAKAGDGSGETQQAAVTGDPDGSASEQINAVYAQLSDGIFGGDPKKACDALTPGAQHEVATQGTAPQPNCVLRMTSILKRNKAGRPGDDHPHIVKLDVKGDSATAIVKTKRSLSYKIGFEKQNGEWKVSSGFSQS